MIMKLKYIKLFENFEELVINNKSKNDMFGPVKSPNKIKNIISKYIKKYNCNNLTNQNLFLIFVVINSKLKNTQMEKNFEIRERILDLMDRNLEIRQKIYTPIKETPFDKFFKWLKSIF